MNPAFEKYLEAKRITKIFEEGTREDRLNFCKEYIQRNQRNDTHPQPKKVLVNMDDIVLLQNQLEVNQQIFEIEQSIDSKEYIKHITDQLHYEFSPILPKYTRIYQGNDFATGRMKFRANLAVLPYDKYMEAKNAKRKEIPETKTYQVPEYAG